MSQKAENTTERAPLPMQSQETSPSNVPPQTQNPRQTNPQQKTATQKVTEFPSRALSFSEKYSPINVPKIPKLNGPVKVLMVSEKPSIALSIAKILSGGEVRISEQFIDESDGNTKGLNPRTRVFRHFSKSTSHISEHRSNWTRIFVSLVSVMHFNSNSTNFTAAYQDWNKDPALLFDADIIKEPSSKVEEEQLKGSPLGHLQTSTTRSKRDGCCRVMFRLR